MSIALVVEIIGDASKLAKELGSAEGDVKGFGGSMLGTATKVAAVAGVAAIAATAIADMTSAAVEDQAEQDRLTAAIKAAGAAHGDYAEQVDAAIAAGQDKAFTDTQTREALMSLVTATGDVTSATDELAIAQDIARFANVDLATAADAVAKAHAGQDGALRKLMPGLEKGATAADTLAAATGAAAGQADTYANSAQGMQDRAGDAFGELSETIGAVFIPVLEALLPAIIPILKSLGELVVAVLPLLTPLIKLVADQLLIAVGIIKIAVDWISKLVRWFLDAAGAVGDFLDKINPLKNIKLPSLPFLSSSGSSAGAPTATTRAGSSSSAAFAPTVNVYTTGDGIDAEQAVVRALRRVARLNGGVIPAAGFQS